MSQPIIVRATADCRVVNGRKDPSKRYGFQTFGLLVAEGMFEKFDKMFDPEKPHFLPPGDYEIRAGKGYVDRDGRLQIEQDFLPFKQAAKAA